MAEEEKEWWPTEDDRITVSKRLSDLLPEGHRPVFTEKLCGSVSARIYWDGFWMDFLFFRSHSGYSYDLWSHPNLFLSPLKHTGPSCSSLEEAVDDAFAFAWPRFADAASKITYDEAEQKYRCEICDTTVSNSASDTLVHCLREHPYSETKSALKV